MVNEVWKKKKKYFHCEWNDTVQLQRQPESFQAEILWLKSSWTASWEAEGTAFLDLEAYNR